VKRSYSIAFGVLLITLQSSFCGCSLFVSPEPYKVSEDTGFLVHLVRGGNETLSQITWWYTKDSLSVSKLQAINARIASDGLQIGEVVLIPTTSVKTVAPMPRVGTLQYKPEIKKSSRNKSASKPSPQLKNPPHVLGAAEAQATPTSEEVFIDDKRQLPDSSGDEELSTGELSAALGFSGHQDAKANGAASQATDNPEVDRSLNQATSPRETSLPIEAKSALDLSLEELVLQEQKELERQRRELEAR